MEYAETDWQAADDAEPQTIDAEVEADFEVEDDPLPFADEAHPEPAESTEAEAVCPTCGELLAWHEEYATCRPAVAPAIFHHHAPADIDDFSQEPAAEAVERPPLFHLNRAAGRASFAYELGHRVQPTPTLTAEVIWRGQLKERHPATGLVHRVNVYRLNDGYWDCYREEELQAA